MRLAALLLALMFAEGCDGPSATPAEQHESGPSPDETRAPKPAPGSVDGETRGAMIIPGDPPEDPALAKLSASRRNEYARGYRDCRNGEFNYDAQTQGEYYRIGCMAAENLKAAPER